MGDEPYGARFRDSGASRGGPDVLGDDEAATAAWPRWLTRGGALVAAAAVLVAAVRAAGPDDDVAAPVPTRTAAEPVDGPPVTIVRNTPPPAAPLVLAAATSELWPVRGYSYLLDLSNPTDTDYLVIDVGFPVQGAEIAWDTTLPIAGETSTRLTVDFLVNNCAAVLGRPAPEELRLTVRPVDAAPGEAGTVAVMHLDLHEASAALDSAGGVNCDRTRPVVLGLP